MGLRSIRRARRAACAFTAVLFSLRGSAQYGYGPAPYGYGPPAQGYGPTTQGYGPLPYGYGPAPQGYGAARQPWAAPVQRRPYPTEAVASVAEQYLLQSINAERAAAGLPPVHFNAGLQQAARRHALQIAYANDLSHRLHGEPDLLHRGLNAGAHFSRISENLASGMSLPEMHVALMHSTHHRENILDGNVDRVGIAVVVGNGQLWAVEDFSDTAG